MEIVEFVFNLLVYLLNTVIWLFSSALNLVFSILPDSPFLELTALYDTKIHLYLSYLSWFIPIKRIISILTLWLGCMLIYYVYSVVMRWIKLIE